MMHFGSAAQQLSAGFARTLVPTSHQTKCKPIWRRHFGKLWYNMSYKPTDLLTESIFQIASTNRIGWVHFLTLQKRVIDILHNTLHHLVGKQLTVQMRNSLSKKLRTIQWTWGFANHYSRLFQIIVKWGKTSNFKSWWAHRVKLQLKRHRKL